MPKTPITTGTMPNPFEEFHPTEGETGRTHDGVDPDLGDEQAEDRGYQGSEERLWPASPVTQGQSHDHQGEKLGRSELERETGQGQGHQDEPHRGEGSADERTDRRDRQRRTRPSLLGHLVSVQTGDHGSRFAGRVDEDRGNRPPYMAP